MSWIRVDAEFLAHVRELGRVGQARIGHRIAIIARNATKPALVKNSRGIRAVVSRRISLRSTRPATACGIFKLSCLRSAPPGLEVEALGDAPQRQEKHVELAAYVVALNQLAQPGAKWFLVTANYALGHQFEADAKTLVGAKSGAVVGSTRHPFPANDLSAQLLMAQSSGATVVALANPGRDTVNGIKAVHDFGLLRGPQKLTAFFLTVMDVKGIGLEVAQGTILSESFYWDVDERTRAFSEWFRAQNGTVPSTNHAGIYSAVRHYLKAVAATRSDEAKTAMAAMAAMRTIPIKDDVVRNARLREDGRMVHDVYVFQVKKPEQSKGEWDLYNTLATIPGDQAFRPLAQGGRPAIGR